jgi:sec-independent protein translocase protein TatC
MSTVASEIRANSPIISWNSPVRRLIDFLWSSLLVGAVALSEMGFLDHLEELRRRIIKSLIAVGIGVSISLAYTPELIRFLGRPAHAAGIPLTAIGATEIFSLYFKVAMAGGICFAAPVIFWQVWRFIEPALHQHEKRYAVPFILSTILCFAGGVAFGYAIASPWFLTLEMTWAKAANINFEPSSLSYFGLLTSTVVAMGLVFEMPPIVGILSRIGLVSAGFLVRHIKHGILISAIVAAVATPNGDFPTLLAFTCVILAIFAVSIVVAWVCGRPRREEV